MLKESQQSQRVVDFTARKRRNEIPQQKVPAASGLTVSDLTTFLKVCDHLRQLGDRNVASISITDEELTIETKHFGQVDESETMVFGQQLVLCSTMSFEGLGDVEDLQALLAHIKLD